ncbi:MAG: carboxypeptidase-like regulatory domain-containing protein [Acidobacteria bacterium]|nr:carboxypeptidase-like regulatory domain-containing protein [Acidobacteriota bacterium]MDA1233305.1 carboxypeptidase-like regulatory domain-containing protein [Acidobacteriota bacterium]
MRTVFLFVALVVAARAQQPPPGLSPQEPKLFSDGVISGTVTDSRSEPLAGAWVVLEGYTRSEKPERIARHASSDAAGSVRFANLPNGAYRFTAQMAGRHFEWRGPSVTLGGAKAEGRFDLVLPRKPVLTGRIFDEAGFPLERARVQTLRHTFNDGVQFLMRGESAATDDRGIFRIVLREPGRYWLMVSHTERSFPFGSAPRSTGVAFYPNSPDLLTATAVEVAFDQPEQTLDLTLPVAPATALTSAIVSGPAGKPCLQCRYSLRRIEGAFSYEIVGGATSREPGFNYFGIPPGLYRIYVEDQGVNNLGWWGVAETVVADGRPSEALIATQPPMPISGKIVLHEPPSELPELSPEAGDPIRINLGQPNGSDFFSMRGRSRSHVQLPFEEAEFSLGPVPPGRYRFQVSVQGASAYLAGISRQGRPLVSPVLDLSQPGPWTNLELHISFGLASVEIGIAEQGAALGEEATYRLLIAPDDETNPFGQRWDSTCNGGEHCFSGSLPPGRYRAVAIEQTGASPQNFQNPETWQALGPWVRTFTLTAGENPAVQLTSAPGASLPR